MSFEQIWSHGPIAIVEIFSKYKNRKDIGTILQSIKNKIKIWLNEIGEDYIETLLAFALRLSKPVASQIFTFFDQEFSSHAKHYTMSYEQYLKNQGFRQGKAEGRKEGRTEGIIEGRIEGKAEGKAEGKNEGIIEGKIEVAQLLLKEGFNHELIYKITGIEPDCLEKITKK